MLVSGASGTFIWGDLDLGSVHVFLLSYLGGLWRSGVYPPEQSTSWNHRNRLLDVRHIVRVIVLRSLLLLLEMTHFFVTAIKINVLRAEWSLTSHGTGLTIYRKCPSPPSVELSEILCFTTNDQTDLNSLHKPSGLPG